MKTALTLFLTLAALTTFAQTVVTGTLVDSKTLEPLEYGTIIIPGTAVGCTLDTTGGFTLNIRDHTRIRFSSFTHRNHDIYNIKVDSGRVDLGQISVIEMGFSGSVSVSKKKFLSKKTKLVCGYVDNRKELQPEDFIVNCPNGNGFYIWTFDEKEDALSLDFETIINCTQYQPSK